MNKVSPQHEAIIDKMLCLAYPIRVISEVAQVSRNTVQARRTPMVSNRGFWNVTCPCGKPVIDPQTDHFHDTESCERRARRTRLLLRIIRKKRRPIPTKIKLSADAGQYVPVGPAIPPSKQALRDMLTEAVRNTARTS